MLKYFETHVFDYRELKLLQLNTSRDYFFSIKYIDIESGRKILLESLTTAGIMEFCILKRETGFVWFFFIYPYLHERTLLAGVVTVF